MVTHSIPVYRRIRKAAGKPLCTSFFANKFFVFNRPYDRYRIQASNSNWIRNTIFPRLRLISLSQAYARIGIQPIAIWQLSLPYSTLAILIPSVVELH